VAERPIALPPAKPRSAVDAGSAQFFGSQDLEIARLIAHTRELVAQSLGMLGNDATDTSLGRKTQQPLSPGWKWGLQSGGNPEISGPFH
jgi:hypothetical protein